MPAAFDPMFDTAPSSPFRYGASPWHVRGHAYKTDLQFTEKHVPGGVDAVIRKLGDADLGRFYEQSFSGSAYYDVMPAQVFGVGTARVLGVSHATFLRRVAEYHVKEALTGFTGVVLRALSPETLASWMPRMLAAYDDYGTVKTTSTAPGVVRGVRTGMPQVLVGSTVRFSMHFLEDILRGVGAREPVVHALGMEREPDRDGQAYWSLGFEVRWT